MSSTYKSPSTFISTHAQPRSDDLGLNNNAHLPSTPLHPSLLSPFNYSHTLSNSASPSYNVNSTPGDSLSDYSNYQPSEFSELEDEFFGIDFDAGVPRTDSLPVTHFDNTAYDSNSLNHPLPDHSTQTDKQQSGGVSNNPAYPLSPKHTSIPNTPSPRSSTNDLKSQSTISQHELISQLHNSRFQPFTPQKYAHPTTVELTPDLSGSSDTSLEAVEPSIMTHNRHNQWGKQTQAFDHTSIHASGQPNEPTSYSPFAPQPSKNLVQTTGRRDEDGVWRSDEITGQAGLNPEARKEIQNVEVPNLKEQEERRRLDHKNSEVQEWRSQGGGSSEDDESYFNLNDRNSDGPIDPNSHQAPAPEEENDIAPLDDTASIHENRLIEGQIYYNANATPTHADIKHMQQPRHWSDAPMVPHTTFTEFQPSTAADAIRRWNDNSDAISLTSRVATWGTRRRSEPNLADYEGVTDGSFLKRLSITKSRDGNRNRQNSIFDQGLQGLDKLASIVRNRSESKLKRARSTRENVEQTQQPSRHNSQSSQLAPPSRSSFSRVATPSVNTAFAAMTGPLAAVGSTSHAKSGSANAANNNSPKSPTGSTHLSFRGVINRARSRSELTTQEKSQKAAQSGIVGLWKSQGGPPVASLSSPPLDVDVKPQKEFQDLEDDEDEEDEQTEESDLKIDQHQEPVVPNYEGFKAHVRRLNPDMDHRYNWLISRIAHQQEIRYKSLLDQRVKHSQSITSRTCNAGPHCIALGGNATLLDVKGNPKIPANSGGGLQLRTDFSDDDSNPGEGALTDDTFPPGVPMPPCRNLPAEFECQLCFKAKKFQKPSDWTKHVHEDVQPFTCTYEKCKESKSFKRKADWVRHENERHRHLEWWICQMADCTHPCFRKDNFLQHLVREHKLPEPKQKTKAAIKKARLTEPAWIMLEQCHHETQNKPQDELCKFCGKSFNTWKKLTVHLAKHMEQMSLPVLRLVEQRTVDANTIISPVEQIPTPISPAKIEGRSPFNMNSVSPHPHFMGQQFTSGFEQPTYFPTTSAGASYGMQSHIPSDGDYDQSVMYPIPYNAHQLAPPRGYNTLASNMSQSRGFESMDSTFSHGKVEQPRTFTSVEPGLSHNMTNNNYHHQQMSPYPIQNTYASNVTQVSGYEEQNMLRINDAGYGYNQMAMDTSQNFQNIPMSRAQGSASSYGHSPQHIPQNRPYYGHP